MKRFNFFLPEKTIDKLNHLAKKTGRTKSSLIREAIFNLLRAFGLVAMILFIGCAPSDEEYFTAKIENWQNRQEQCAVPENEFPTSKRIGQDLKGVVAAYPIPHTYDDVDYWQTTNETLDRGTGDCEDQATLYMMLLSKSNLVSFHNLDVRGRVVSLGDKKHIVTLIYTPTDTYHISDQAVVLGEPGAAIVEFDDHFFF